MGQLEQEFLADREALLYPEPVPMAPAETVIPGESTMAGEPLPGGMTTKEFAVGLADTAAAGLKGAVQGWVGLPGDIESIGRMIINLVGGNVDQETYLKTTEEIKALLDSYAPFEPMGKRISKEDLGAAEIAGEFLAPGTYVKPVKAAAKSMKSAVTKGVESIPKNITTKGATLATNVEVPVAKNIASPEFKTWLGDSKIKTNDGKPQVMYHGTDQDIHSFKGDVIFVSPSPEFASRHSGASGNVIPLYVKAVNPFDYDNPKHRQLVIEKALQLHGEKVINGKTAIKEVNPFNKKEFVIWDNETLDAVMSSKELNNWGIIEMTQIQDAIKSLGFDSFYVKEQKVKNLGIYSPTQVKSVFNKGTWNPDDPRILHGIGGGAVGAGATAMPTSKENK